MAIRFFIFIFLFSITLSVDGRWMEWSEWSPCSRTCDGGTQERQRSCQPPQHGGRPCLGDTTEINTCNRQPCDSEWPLCGSWAVQAGLSFTWHRLSPLAVLLPVCTVFTMEGSDSALAKFTVPTLKAFLKARSHNEPLNNNSRIF